jgi:hypothetical protein
MGVVMFWESLFWGSAIHRNPAVTSWGPDRVDLFTVDSKGLPHPQLQHAWTGLARPNRDDWGNELLGGVLRELPPACSSWPAAGGEPARIDIFAIGAGDNDGMLMRYRWQNCWDPIVPLPGHGPGFLANCGPAVAADMRPLTRRLDVFAIDNPEGAFGPRTLQHWWINGDDAPSGPERLGGRLWDVPPCAVVRQAGTSTLDVLAISDTGTLQHWSYANGWHGPVSRGGNLANGAGPAAVSWGGDRLDVFAIGADQTMQHWWVNGDEWNGPEQLLGATLEAGTPAAVSRAPGSVEVFATQVPQAPFAPRHVHWWTSNAGWSQPQEIFNLVSVGGPAALVRHPLANGVPTPRVDLFAVQDSNAFSGSDPDADMVLWAVDDPA